MTTMTRWNPFKPSTQLDPLLRFDDMFRGLTSRPMWHELDTTPDMRIDVSEDDKAFHIRADVPGVDKNDIEISVDGNQVMISAEVKRESSRKEGEESIYTERYCGKAYRAITLPGDFDSTISDAHYDNGVLTLSLPKKANGSSRKIRVS
ncbi:MAG: Hsp20/alpha crystallin family protein [Xanthomonadaceae bacterium]|jgi:HSP20 family protein|nr:Hsp20/alpha crystallin family protein [Xanthomonadaceae bacterium]MDE2247412.1 Hsp20/alpha crystallin family protein [Xanthomonadaceae bacterium]